MAGGALAFLEAITVFVPEDLAFMQTSLPTLKGAGASLVPVIAHDRAGFGGALVTDGLAVLLVALWGYRQSARWLWWTFFSASTIAFFALTSVHLVVGYTDLFHLLPVIIGIARSLPPRSDL